MAFTYAEIGDFEQGYNILIEFLKKISHSFWIFIIFYALFITTVNIKLQKKYAIMPFFCLLLYVCNSFYSLFLVRQYIAMTICLLTIPYILNRKFIYFFLLTLLASTFHRTAYIWLLVYFVTYAKVNFKWLVLICVSSIALIKGLDMLIGNLARMMSRIESYITLDEEQYTWKTLVVSGAVLGYVCICYGRNLKKIEGFEKICFFMLVFSMLLDIINVMGTSFKAIYRIKPYCSMFVPFILPYATTYIKKREFKILATIIISCLYLWLLVAGINQQRGWFGFII